MTISLTKAAKDYYNALAEELSINDHRYEQAHSRYHSLGEWLNRDASSVKNYAPAVYVQGSFGLGTVIKPITEDEDYDVDSVCELKALAKSQLSQCDLKVIVRTEIEAYRKANNMVKPLGEGRRCWTLNYADGAQFHMDIVPALPNSADVKALLARQLMDTRWSATAIAITDKESTNYKTVSLDWPRSNPKGYLEWFKSRMAVPLAKKRRQLADSLRASVEDIPDYKVRTPLQAAIMILKRHRDIMFVRDVTNSGPISIIITTLAAHAYQGEEDIGEALLSILSKMDQFVLWDGQKYVIQNPTDALENFADKWQRHPERAQAFFNWLKAARQHFTYIATISNHRQITDFLSPHLGSGLTSRTAKRFDAPAQFASLLRPATAASTATTAAPAFGREPRVPTKPQGFA